MHCADPYLKLIGQRPGSLSGVSRFPETHRDDVVDVLYGRRIADPSRYRDASMLPGAISMICWPFYCTGPTTSLRHYFDQPHPNAAHVGGAIYSTSAMGSV